MRIQGSKSVKKTIAAVSSAMLVLTVVSPVAADGNAVRAEERKAEGAPVYGRLQIAAVSNAGALTGADTAADNAGAVTGTDAANNAGALTGAAASSDQAAAVTGADAVSAPVVSADSTTKEGKTVIWDSVNFGSYPQREVITAEMTSGSLLPVTEKTYQSEDFVVSDELYAKLSASTDWVGDELTIDGTRYRRMKKGDAVRAASSRTQTDYYWSDANTYHFFRYDPIRWRVLEKDGTKVLLLADGLLDDMKYNDTSVNCAWEASTIRSWLNGYAGSDNQAKKDFTADNFIDTAFTGEQKETILPREVMNLTNLHLRTAAGSDTRDQVFLLSEAETYHTEKAAGYGFSKDENIYDDARQARPTTYAKAMGTRWNAGDGYLGKSLWSLRSPGATEKDAVCIFAVGFVSIQGVDVDTDYGGVRPAIWVDLSRMTKGNMTLAGTVRAPGTAKSADNTASTDQQTQTGTPAETETVIDTGNTGETQTNAGESQTKTLMETETVIDTGNTGGTQTAAADTAETEVVVDQTENEETNKPSNGVFPSVKKAQTISVTGSAKTLTPGKQAKLTAKVLPEDTTYKKVIWKSDRPDYASVDQNGQVTAKFAGIGRTVTITASAADGSGTKGMYSLVIQRDKITKIKLLLKKRSGNKYYIRAKISGTGSSISTELKWSVNNKKYAKITADGQLKIKKAGRGHKIRVTAKAKDGSGVKASIKIKIT